MNAPTAKAKAETQVESIKMADGRVVDFAGKRKMLKDSSVSADGIVSTRLDFRNGQTRLFTVPANLLHKFAAHGAEQKLGDEIAGVEDLDDAILGIDELIDRLYNGDWSIKREGNGLAGTSILLRALCELQGKSPEVVRAWLKEKTPAQKAALRSNAKLKPIIERLEAEKASKATKVDTDGLLAELEAGTAGTPDASGTAETASGETAAEVAQS